MRLAILADAASVNIEVWCEGLSHAGADIHLISFSDCVPKATWTHRLHVPQLPGKLYYFAALPYVRRMFRFIQPHVVVAYYATGYGTLGTLAGYHPLILVTAGSDLILAPSNPVMKQLVRFNLSRADLIQAFAPHMAQAAERLGAARAKILVLPRGIPFQRFSQERSSPPTGNVSPHIISTRSLRADYNTDLLLRAIRLLHENGVICFLTLAGDGPQREELVTLAQNLALENQVRFVGFVPNQHLPISLAQHNLYVSLVSSDGVSASLLEAMAVGLFPIVPDNSANRFWINPGENGLLLHELSPVAVAEAIRHAISDIPLRQRAWQKNSEIVRSRGDLYRNSEIFMEHARRLTRICRK